MKNRISYIVYRISLTILSAVFLILAFPNFNLSFLAWIGLVPLFFALDNQKLQTAFKLSYISGILFFLSTIYWLIHVTLPGMIIVVLYLALYFGVFGLLYSYITHYTSHITQLFLVPAVWVSLELIRSHLFTGFGWNLLAHSQSHNLPVIQIADITGAYGVSFLVAMVNTAVFLTIKEFRNKKYSAPCLAIALFLVFVSLSYGMFRMKNIFTGETLRVAVIQGNIPQKNKWDADFREEIIGNYESLTKDAAESSPDLIIWPEASVPGFLESEQDLLLRVKSLARESKAPVLVGAPREGSGPAEEYYNSAFLFSPGGETSGRYDKIHLVPFGEYLPLKKAFFFVENFAPSPIGDFTAGEDYTVFRFFVKRSSSDKDASWRLTKKISFSCLICFEDIFPDLTRRFVREGADFLVNITNDAWFGNSSAPFQHAQNSVFRAVENRTNVVRAANTGLSCFIDQKGKIAASVSAGGRSIFVEGIKVHDIVLMKTKTFYTVYGDVFAYSCTVFALVYMIGLRFRMRKGTA